MYGDRYEPGDGRWLLIEHHFPANGKRGGQWKDHRTVVDGVLWVLCPGAAWRDPPERYGPFQTVHRRHLRWRRDGAWERVLAGLRMRADGRGPIDWARCNADSTSVRATRHAAGAREKGGRSRTSRRTTRAGPQPRRVRRQAARADRRQRPRAAGGRDPRQPQRVPGAGAGAGAAAGVGPEERPGPPPRAAPRRQGYSCDRTRDGPAACGIRPPIPMRDNEHANDRGRWGGFDRAAYRRRNVAERCIAKPKEFRRVATRYEELAESFAGMVDPAAILLYLPLLDSRHRA